MENAALAKEGIATKLTLGQILDIEIQNGSKMRFQTPLLGMKDGQYLLTELPGLTKQGNLRDHLTREQEIIVRTICEKTTGECLGFKAHVSAKLTQPAPLLFISFPNNVQVHELRKNKRMLVTQPAYVTVDSVNAHIYGTLVDLSGGGWRFEYEDALKLQYNKNDTICIDFNHPETGAKITSKARVCSVRNINNIVSLGLAFLK